MIIGRKRRKIVSLLLLTMFIILIKINLPAKALNDNQGCCSWHGGVYGCRLSELIQCNDGFISSCTCIPDKESCCINSGGIKGCSYSGKIICNNDKLCSNSRFCSCNYWIEKTFGIAKFIPIIVFFSPAIIFIVILFLACIVFTTAKVRKFIRNRRK